MTKAKGPEVQQEPTHLHIQDVPPIAQPISEGRQATMTAVRLSQAALDEFNAIQPLGGSFEERLAAFNERLGGPEKSGHTSPSKIIFAVQEFGLDVIQAVIDSGRLSY